MVATPVPATIPPFAVDRSSPVPLYYQVSQHLEHAISSGAIPPGTLFENELVLCEQLRVSRETMRRAMEYLVDKGLVVRRRGIGTRVVQPKVRRHLELSSLYDDLSASGQQPSTQVLGVSRTPADDEVAERLGVPVGTEVTRLDRLRSAAERPIARMTNFLTQAPETFEGSVLEAGGLYELLRTEGVRLHSAHQTIGARPATPEEHTLLGEEPGCAVLTLQRVTYDDHGVAVEYGSHVYAASRYGFELSLLTK
jgi:GntR family transcriptional regulator